MSNEEEENCADKKNSTADETFLIEKSGTQAFNQFVSAFGLKPWHRTSTRFFGGLLFPLSANIRILVLNYGYFQ